MTIQTQNITLPHTQGGAVLVVSLLILLIMTIVGVSSIQTTTLEERMAGNTRDQNLAFQSAEAALIEGENALANLVLFVAGNGQHLKGDAPNEFDTDTWANDAKSTVAVSLNDDQNARYYIEAIGSVNPNGTSSAQGKNLTFDPGGNKGTEASSTITGYRVVAIGEGPKGTAQSIVQSYYGKKELQ